MGFCKRSRISKLEGSSMNKYEITWDEQYHLIKLYDLLRDNGMMDDLPKEIETFFEKLMD